MRKKRKLTAAEKAEKKRRRQEFETMFIGGKMKRVCRPPTIDGMDPEEFILRNADPIWLHQNEMWASGKGSNLSSIGFIEHGEVSRVGNGSNAQPTNQRFDPI